MRKRALIWIGILSMLICPGIIMAEAQNDGADRDENVYSMEELVVSATRYEELIVNVPANVSIITADDISNATARDVPDLLRTAGGIHVNDITGGRRNYTVDLRGFGESAGMNTLVLVDGRRTNQADLSGVDWTQIPLDRVERIEIVRGGRASALYGDNAAGGVINIITKKGNGIKTGGQIQAGSYDSYKVSAYTRGSADAWSYAISGSYADTDGYRENSQNLVKDIGADVSYRYSEPFRINLSAGYHEDKAGLPGAIKESEFAAGVHRKDSVNPDNYVATEDYYIKAGPELHILTDSLVRIDASYRNRDFQSYANFAGGYFNGDTDIETVTFSPQVVIREQLCGYTNNLNIGMDYTNAEEDIVNTSEYFGFLSQGEFNLEKKNVGYYIHDELTITESLSISGGYRFDTAEYTFASSLAVVDPNKVDYDESLFTFGINYKFNSNSNAYVGYSRSYRYPALDEIFNFFMNAIDSSLAPQTSSDYEVGIRYALSDNTNVGINLFYIETDDEIYYNPNWYSNMNMDGKTVRQGVEMTAAHRFGWGKVDVDYTYTDADIDGGTYDGSNIPNVPEHQAGFNVLVDVWNPVTVAINGRYVGKRVFISDWTNTFDEQENYFVTNAKFKYAWNQLEAFVNINNLFNEDYSEYGVLGGFPLEKAYYPSPETNFLMGFSLNF